MTQSSGVRPAPPAATDPGMNPRLSVRELSKTFGPATVLRDVTFSVAPGEIHGLIGQNGSGKSTLIKVFSGVHRADSGARLAVDGETLPNPVLPADLRRHGLAFVHQDLGLVQDRTVLENMRLGHFTVRRLSRRIDWDAEREAARRTLERLHAEIDTARLVRGLPPGDQAIVAVGRALQSIVPGSGCVVFDESTRALPRELLPEFYATVRRLADAGTSVIVVSHRLEEVLALCDRVSVLQDGRMVASGRDTASLNEATLAALLLGRELEMLEERRPSTGGRARSAGPASPPAGALVAEELDGGGLAGISLRIAPGEILGVTGPTGSGAATLPAALAGADPDVRGRVTIGERSFSLPVREPARLIEAGLAFVPEDRAREGIALGLTAQENLTLPRVRARGRILLRDGWQSAEFRDAVGLLGILPPRPHLPCASFSGGNQQKILLGKWLLNRPRVIVLHEPTQAVDIGARMDILRALRATADGGVAVVISSIEPQDLAAVCDRVLVLRDGAVAAEIADEITPQTITEAVYPSATTPIS